MEQFMQRAQAKVDSFLDDIDEQAMGDADLFYDEVYTVAMGSAVAAGATVEQAQEIAKKICSQY
jgi:hypothetical protein